MLTSNGLKTVGTLTAMAVFGTTGAYMAGSAFADTEHRSTQGATHANPQAPAGAKRRDAEHRSPKSIKVDPTPTAEPTPLEQALSGTTTPTASPEPEEDVELTDEEREASKAAREARKAERKAEREAAKAAKEAARDARKAEHTDRGKRRDAEHASSAGLEKRHENAGRGGNGGL